ncbi:hypothetical protein DFJ58DRAFT_730772 [Suillus subalutaceus]|uniref:uncharacterized protein n=1 Tax=Suillus subalutaceus TaxID=48586 RepID=UPI001B8736FE|nr:uncharacterized protein DFJ58DRAFT_730772 [Suillus subalutaceus]KAG1845713.1 hypothetical protein DFJ58DRAFT_730772 [Suillus subalutaceus]
MSLPQALQDFFDMLSDPDIEGYDADTSLSLPESNMPPGLMTPSDDLVVDPAYWLANLEREHLMRQQFNESVNMCPTSTALESDLTITILPQTLNTGSAMESESDPTTPTMAHIPPCPYQDDTGSTTESESETDSLLDGYFNVCPSMSTARPTSTALESDLTITILPQTLDTGSATESESDPTTPTMAHIPCCPYQDDTGSTTESESETDSLLNGYFVI